MTPSSRFKNQTEPFIEIWMEIYNRHRISRTAIGYDMDRTYAFQEALRALVPGKPQALLRSRNPASLAQDACSLGADPEQVLAIHALIYG